MSAPEKVTLELGFTGGQRVQVRVVSWEATVRAGKFTWFHWDGADTKFFFALDTLSYVFEV